MVLQSQQNVKQVHINQMLVKLNALNVTKVHMVMELPVLKVSQKVVNCAVKVHKIMMKEQKIVIYVQNIHNVIKRDALNAQIVKKAIIVKTLDA